MNYISDIILLAIFSNSRLCTGICDGQKWFCIDYVPISKCRPCDPYYLSIGDGLTIGNEFLNMINKYVCLSNILKQPCVKGCIATHRTYCNVMYKSIPENSNALQQVLTIFLPRSLDYITCKSSRTTFASTWN